VCGAGFGIGTGADWALAAWSAVTSPNRLAPTRATPSRLRIRRSSPAGPGAGVT